MSDRCCARVLPSAQHDRQHQHEKGRRERDQSRPVPYVANVPVHRFSFPEAFTQYPLITENVNATTVNSAALQRSIGQEYTGDISLSITLHSSLNFLMVMHSKGF